MTTDEMVAEIMAANAVLVSEPNPMTCTVMPDRTVRARCGRYYAESDTPTAAIQALRGQMRDAASKALGEHEAKAETLRKALDIPSPEMRYDDLRAAVRGYFAARRDVDHVMQVSRSVTEATEASARLDAAESALRDAVGGDL